MRNFLYTLARSLQDAIVVTFDSLTLPFYLLSEGIENAINHRTEQYSCEPECEDPCDTCLRWDECNGIDRGNCPKL